MPTLVFAVLLLLSPTQAKALGLDIFMAMHWCHCNVSAVHLDGNTSLFSPKVWLPATTSSPRFMRAWWEKGSINVGTAAQWVVWSANDQYSDFIDITESTDPYDSKDFIEIDFVPFIGGQRTRYGYYCRTLVGEIPRGPDAPWTFIMVQLDVSTGECAYYVQYGGHSEGGEMIYPQGQAPPQATFPWGAATGWWIAGNSTASQQPAMMDTAEAFLDLSTKYDHNSFINGTTAFQFVSPGGYARNLDVLLSPLTHNCAGPTGGVIPEMCNRGGAHAFPDGPEVAPGLDAYMMQVIGTLTTATSDPCWIHSPSGDGCSGY